MNELKLHKVTIIDQNGREKDVRFPLDEIIYRNIKKEPKGIRKNLFGIMYRDYLKELNSNKVTVETN